MRPDELDPSFSAILSSTPHRELCLSGKLKGQGLLTLNDDSVNLLQFTGRQRSMGLVLANQQAQISVGGNQQMHDKPAR